jgi:Pretoxin HINT domain
LGDIGKAICNVAKAAAPAIAHAVQKAAPVVAAVADSVLGVSSMVNDFKTIVNPNVSWSSRLLSLADLTMNAAMDVSMVMGTGEAARTAYMGLKTGAKLAGKEVEHVVADEAEHLATKELENVGEKSVADAVKGAACSFAGNTPVATPDGSRPIATIKVGDQVLAVDGANGKVTAKTVQQVFVNQDADLVNVTIAPVQTTPQGSSTSTTKQQDAAVAAHGAQAPPAETLQTTSEHPFLTAELGWVAAGDLQLGEHVRRIDGSLGVVVAVAVTPGIAARYNLTVQDDHTYLVGQGQWVVHNTCGGNAISKFFKNEKVQGALSGFGIGAMLYLILKKPAKR